MSKDTDTDVGDPSPVIVAMTASAARAGSLEALLRQFPPQPDAAIVVVLQHMEAFDEDRFRAAARAGGHEPGWIEDGGAIEPGRLYLNPRDMIVTVEDGHFAAQPTHQAPGLQGVIDSFMVSLARERRGRAIGVALAGTDGDGTLGAREMKAAGGVVLAECVREDLAHSDSAAALADAVLPLEDIAARLRPSIEQATHRQRAAAGGDRPETREMLRAIAGLLRQKTGHDFHGYKPGTFLRRVHRRMQALLINDLKAYVDLLRSSPNEPQSLFNDLLIGVTEFFRDRKEWEILEKEVIPRLFEDKPSKSALRVWVAGCSTGEEAYSLAILLAEHRAKLDDPPQVQIFASDLDGRALAMGRAGRYPDTIAGHLSQERLARWFVREGDTYCVIKELREMCIFSQHSLIKDAPFSRLDLVSCRNLLIYLDADLQEKVIPLFHFALRPGGFLFLGNSENASRHTQLFAPVEARSRIFRRLDTATRVFPDFPFTSVDRRWTDRAARSAPDRGQPAARELTRWAEHVMERHTPAFVVIDEAYTVLHFSGPMGRYLAPSSGTASLNLLQLAHPVLRAELRAALVRAVEEGQAVELPGLDIGANGQRLRVDVIVEPRLSVSDSQPGFIVIFKECGIAADRGTGGDAAAGQRDEQLSRLEDDLRLTRDRLQATIEELESTNEELKSSNEEYQSLNKELQSANEELETSKEELQSVNEELTTVNGELAHRVQELGRANSDLKNFLESTQIATLFLDGELRVTNFTPAIVDVFHLVESDEGRPIEHIKARVGYDSLAEDARRVLRTLAPVEREIDNPASGTRYIARVLPYRSTDNFIAGVVVTFVDVTARREAEEQLRRSEERFRAIVETARDYAIFTTDTEGRIETWPPGARQVFGWGADEAVGQPLDITFTPEDREAGQPALERRTALEDGQAPDVRWHLRKDGTRVFIEGSVRPLLGRDRRPAGFLKIGQDVTGQRAIEAALRASEANQAFLLRLSDALRPLADPDAI